MSSGSCTGIFAAGSSASTSRAKKLKAALGPLVRTDEVYKPFPEQEKVGENVIKALVCRAWDSKSPYGKYLATEYIISDEKGSAMHCIARSSIAHCVVTKLQIGNIYSIRRFTVEANKELYCVKRDDPYVIQLEGSTIIQKLECSDFGFVRQPFHLKDIEEIAYNGSKVLIDVVGRVINLSEYKPTKNGSHYCDFHLINERGRSIKVTLWGLLGKELIDSCGDPDALNVIALPAMNISEYRGGIKLCNTSGTMIYDNHDIPEIAELRLLMGYH